MVAIFFLNPGLRGCYNEDHLSSRDDWTRNPYQPANIPAGMVVA
jgi:hypothetical protein